jgi:hypothetical protein
MPSISRLRHRLILFPFLGLLVLLGSGPAPAVAALPQVNWLQLDQTLQTLAVDSNFLVAEFRGSTCAPIHQRDADRSLAIASTFKLYVLGELSRQILNGTAAWDDEITLTASLRSMPSGHYAFVREGTKVPVLDLAEAMIWQSDNTATDHLISYLGREHVRRAFAAFGHSDPAVNTPLLLTREMFAIKMTQSPEWMAKWMAADDAAQLDMLRDDIDPLHIDPAGGWGKWNGPTAIDGIEWFASAADLCRATVGLWTMGAQPGLHQVRDILAGNRGAIGDTLRFPQAGYKGGYEAGVVNMTYVLQREDGRVFFVSAGYNSTTVNIDAGTAVSYLAPVFTCLANDACIDAG